MVSLGVLCALIAFVGWGIGDFLIQKGARVIGSVKTLFFIGVVGLVCLLPFVLGELTSLSVADLITLLVLGVVLSVASFLDFEALREGKIAIIEPVVGLELPLTVMIAVWLGGEILTLPELLLVVLVFAGIVLTITTRLGHLHYHKRLLEKGVLIALLAACGIALSNFLVGEASRAFSPLLAVWFVHAFLACVCALYLLVAGKWRTLLHDIQTHPLTIAGFSVFDNIGWIAYAFSMTLIPISIATTISGSYIALAVLLGLMVNREHVRVHQFAGIALVLVGVFTLSYLFA